MGRKVIAELDKVADASKQVLFEKNIKKEKHLKEKFLSTKKSSPGGTGDLDLDRYKTAKIFNKNEANLKSSYSPEEPLVYGDITLDEDEKAAISMDPKFAVFEDLKEEEFETDTEICMVKLKYLAMDKYLNDLARILIGKNYFSLSLNF